MNEDLSKFAGIPITETEVLEVRSRRCNEGNVVITVFARYKRQKSDKITTFTLLLRDVRSGGYAFELSSQIGCPVQCFFCGVQSFERSLTTQEVIEQVALLIQEANKQGVEVRAPRKLSFSDGGELLLNRNCLAIVRQLTDFMEADIKISSVLPKGRIVKRNLEHLLLFKQGFPRTLHLQVSMFSTNELIRQKASKILLLPMAEIAGIGRKWYEATGRKPTLTVTLTSNSHCVVNEISEVLSPAFFCARLHPYRSNGVEGIKTMDRRRLQELAEQFEGSGYNLIIGQFDPSVDRDDSLLFSGTLSFEDPNLEDQESEDSDSEDQDPEDHTE